MYFQYPRTGSWLLLLSPGTGRVSWTTWCWWKWVCHLLHGGLWKRTELISFMKSKYILQLCSVSFKQNPCYYKILFPDVVLQHHCIVAPWSNIPVPWPKHTFRLELDKYVQGLHSSLQTPEVRYYNNSIIICICHYILMQDWFVLLFCVAAPKPWNRSASLSEPVVRGVCNAHLSGGAAGPEQHQLLAACCESFPPLYMLTKKRLVGSSETKH